MCGRWPSANEPKQSLANEPRGLQSFQSLVLVVVVEPLPLLGVGAVGVGATVEIDDSSAVRVPDAVAVVLDGVDAVGGPQLIVPTPPVPLYKRVAVPGPGVLHV